MASGMQVWSQTAASNNTIDASVNMAEGMAPSAVNDGVRALMASAAKWRDDNNGTIATTGTTAAYTVTSNQVSTSNTNGYTLVVKFHATNDSSATLARDTAPAANLQLVAGTNVSGGEFLAGTVHRFKYDSGSTAWIAEGANLLGASSVSSNNLASGSVAYSKIQNETAGTILGNGSTSAAAPAELSIGTGLVATSNSISAPAFPPTAAFKNLSIKVTGNTAGTVAADFVTMATSGSSAFLTLPVSSTMNFATTGADALDTGSLAAGTFYAVYAVASTTSTAAHGLASTSFTTPLMPAPYTYRARVGSVVTATSTSAQNLMGTWQLGRRAQYVAGLAQTSNAKLLDSGVKGTIAAGATWSTVSTTNTVPNTASEISALGVVTTANALVITAPSTVYSGALCPFRLINDSANTKCQSFSMLLENSSAIYWASNDAGTSLYCTGWIDNI